MSNNHSVLASGADDEWQAALAAGWARGSEPREGGYLAPLRARMEAVRDAQAADAAGGNTDGYGSEYGGLAGNDTGAI